MSLVAYGSSDDSDAEERSAATQSKKTGQGGLFSVLPSPKKPTPTDDAQQVKTSLFSSLPKPRKRTEPVRITVPHIQKNDSDSDDDEPVKKKLQSQVAGSGLSSLLPQPKNLTLKEMDRPLIPHTLTKRSESKGAKLGLSNQGLLGSSASPSAIKAAAKSAARQLARQVAATDDQEEDITPQNYFSLGENPEPPPAVVPVYEPEPVAPAEPLPPLPAGELSQSDAPLDFGGGHEGAGAWGGQYPPYQQPMAGPEALPEGYNNEAYYQDASSGLPEAEEPGNSAMFDDEAFMRLQGKRNRGKEEVKFLEIKGDDQLSGHQQWLTKSMSEEKNNRGSFSKKRGGQPTGQQRRKHQITYLIHQAKERELELKNSWAENRMTRRQTQAKYGF
ncbi:proline-rich protein PRCC [Nerophis ophidion]|uniref:proline-rich protein PRCC n=1 Tax=Nerophis ophidion TaxID=159077 RepID=UPI002ADF7443|nr:proline-rich protein PRCC [Nerophis ophidion]